MATLAGSNNVIGAIAMQLPPLTRQLDCTFAGLGTAVEQIGLVAARALTKEVNQLQQTTVMKACPWIDQRLRLAAQRFNQHARAMTETVDCTALGEIEIGVTFTVPQPGTLAANEHLWRTCRGGHQAVARQGFSGRRGNRHRLALGHNGRGASKTEQIHVFNPFANPM
ncbi:hypothetical protein D3C72_1280790 [compost metagenome]